MPSILVVRALALLREARAEEISLAKIATEIDVSRAWISAFKLGKIPNPGVVTIEKLIHALEVALGDSR